MVGRYGRDVLGVSCADLCACVGVGAKERDRRPRAVLGVLMATSGERVKERDDHGRAKGNVVSLVNVGQEWSEYLPVVLFGFGD